MKRFLLPIAAAWAFLGGLASVLAGIDRWLAAEPSFAPLAGGAPLIAGALALLGSLVLDLE